MKKVVVLAFLVLFIVLAAAVITAGAQSGDGSAGGFSAPASLTASGGNPAVARVYYCLDGSRPRRGETCPGVPQPPAS